MESVVKRVIGVITLMGFLVMLTGATCHKRLPPGKLPVVPPKEEHVI